MTETDSTLCLACGLCCDGALFTQVPLSSEEQARVRRRGLPVLERAQGAVLQQRCAALDGCRCEIYDERPAACRGYRCMLLTALGEGEVSLDEALVIVGQAHAAIAEVAQAHPGEGSAMQRARRAPATGAEDIATLQRATAWLGRHFQRDAGQ